MFRVAHYKDDIIILESPVSVEPFYVVLENPTFSPVGVIKLKPLRNILRRKIPTHGIVMLYSRYKTGYTIHLYLMPHDLSLKQAVHNKETGNCFYWVDKPYWNTIIHTRRIYTVEGPEEAEINPKELELRLDDKSELYNYSEIYLKKIEDNILLKLTCRDDDKLT
ncbi:NACHT, LRR and PYD domains-containing protein 1b allele 2 [Xenopus laevis]|uniref:NACHT, LRR and PYD domains-containing protein 1b allele 2 n=1 Tax=Xenopus laevis TaxID=8355 RepID=A0A8J1LU60_XENLA|nr:NACHT, LRR and PYD domains-containing protein 1b allele 2 [Xenopus laevis]